MSRWPSTRTLCDDLRDRCWGIPSVLPTTMQSCSVPHRASLCISVSIPFLSPCLGDKLRARWRVKEQSVSVVFLMGLEGKQRSKALNLPISGVCLRHQSIFPSPWEKYYGQKPCSISKGRERCQVTPRAVRWQEILRFFVLWVF